MRALRIVFDQSQRISFFFFSFFLLGLKGWLNYLIENRLTTFSTLGGIETLKKEDNLEQLGFF